MRLDDLSSTRALTGKRVLVTRPVHQARALSDALLALGATPIELPVIEIVPVPDDELASLAAEIPNYDWIVFTSVNTVEILARWLRQLNRTPKIAAIGDATASAVAALGLKVDLVPDEFVAESVLDAMIERDVAGKRVLLPRADIARDTLPDGLHAAGADVDVEPVYRTRLPEQVDHEILEQVRTGNIDIVTFTSPSTVRNLMRLLDGRFPRNVIVACIGPVTARAAKDAGLDVSVLADEYSIPGLVRALTERGDP